MFLRTKAQIMNPWKISTGILATTTIFFAFETLKDKVRINYFMTDIEYLMAMLAKNGIALEEFDIIALKNPNGPKHKLKRNGWFF